MSRFSEEVIRLAQDSEKKYNVPASVTLAQWAYESTYGTSPLSQKTNNYFGIKYYGTGSNYYASGGSRWQKYNNMSESFEAHGKLLSGKLYAPKTAGATSINQYIDAIAETYAPSSDGNNGYAKTLKQIIAENNLTQYDTMFKTSGEVSSPDVPEAPEQTEYKWYEKGYWESALGNIVKFIVLAGICVLAFILIMKAFNIPTSKKDIAKKVVEKVTEGETDD